MLLALVLAFVAFSGSAEAAPKPPKPSSSAVGQYVEMLPGASGPTAAGARTGSSTPLPAAPSRALRSVPRNTATLLQKVATSTAFGAPARVAKAVRETETRNTLPTSALSFGGALKSGAQTATGQENGRLVAVLVFMLVITAAAAIGATRRRRPSVQAQSSSRDVTR